MCARDAAGNIDKNTIEVTATTPVPDYNGTNLWRVIGRYGGWQHHHAQLDGGHRQRVAGREHRTRFIKRRRWAAKTARPQTIRRSAGATSFAVKDLTPNTTYYFVVRAQDEAGNASTNTQEKSGIGADADVFGSGGDRCSPPTARVVIQADLRRECSI